jgi:hypothetical protein
LVFTSIKFWSLLQSSFGLYFNQVLVFGFKIEIKKHRKITQSIFTFQKGGKKETWKDDPMTGWLENFVVTI